MNIKSSAVLILFLLFFSICLTAQPDSERVSLSAERAGYRQVNTLNIFIRDVVMSIIFGLVGILLAIIGYKLFDIVTPFSLAKELAEDQNIAVGIVVGAIIIGLSIVISKAIM